MTRILILLASLFVVNIAHAETGLEEDCRNTFERPHLWKHGSPTDRHWDQRCWDFVEEYGSGWKWIGSPETRRIAAEKKRKEDERRRKEVERRKKKEEKRLAEIERKRVEAEAEAKRKRLEQERLAKEWEEQRRKVLANYTEMPLVELEKFLGNGSRPSGSVTALPEELSPVVTYYFGHLFSDYLSETADPLKALQKVVQRTKSKGISLARLKYSPVQFLTKRKEIKAGDGGDTFDVRVDVDGIPSVLRPRELSTEEINQEILKAGHKYYVLLYIPAGIIDRKVTSHKTISSEYKFGEETLPNPSYRIAERGADDAYAMLREGQVRQRQCGYTCSGVACFVCLAWIGKINGLNADYTSAKSRLNNTSMTISKPVYRPYEFKKNEIRLKKDAEVGAFIFGKRGELLSVRKLTQSESQNFSLIYSLHEKDKNRHKHTNGISTEQEVSEYENKNITLKFDRLFHSNEVFDREIPAGVLIGQVLDILGSEISRLEGENLVGQSELSVEVETGDKRFQSVVVVLHPEGSIGSGFYVRPDMILTNYHVIEGTKFLEILTYDGVETFGKVVGKDIRLDLALIKVQQRGQPATLFERGSFSAGETVDAIGHPQGLEFSLTRGTISGIRRLSSLYDPGGQPVRFIQSDVAINPGNSGGPLFIGDKVVGVNDWKLADTDLEGLSFSIHISEVKKFLEKHGF